MKKILLLISFCIAAAFAKAQTVYVNSLAGGNNDGTTWADAYTDLQMAIASASSGEIWVATGVYYAGPSAINASTFTLKNNVAIYGGFVGGETLLSQRNPLGNTTTLSGDLDQSTTFNANDAYHVVTTGQTNSSAILDGFTITGGYASGGGTDAVGAGLFCDPNSPGTVNPTIRNCIFSNNSAVGNGGAVFIVCDQTGGNSTAPKFYSCKFYGNNSLSFGGGVYMYATGSLTFCTPFFESCVFYNNAAAGSASCIYAENMTTGEVHATVTNCTFLGNNTGTEIQYQANGINGTFQIDNSIFYGLDLSTDDVFLGDHNCGPMALFSGTTGSFDLDPMLINPGALDFGITCQSPCWEAGNNGVVTHSEDVEGNVRNIGASVDIGAREMPYSAPLVTANGPGAAVCEGTMISVFGSGTGGVTYVWNFGIVTDATPFAATVTNTYTVVGTDGDGCTATDMITVTVNPNPIVNGLTTDLDYVVCEGDLVTLYGSGSPGTYTWDNGVTDNVPFIIGTNNYFTLVAVDANGCSDTSGFMFIIENYTGMSAGIDMNVCNTGTLVANPTGVPTASFPTYFWATTGSGVFDNTSLATPSYTLSPADSTAGYAELIFTVDMTACPDFVDTTVAFVAPLPIVTAPADITVCETDTVFLIGNVSGGTGPYIYNWTNPGTLSTTLNSDYYIPFVTENISFSASDAYGCSASDTFTVFVDANNLLSGTMYVGAAVLTDGTFLLLKYEPQQQIFDTIFGNQFSAGTGTFSFPIPHGDYLIKIIPDTFWYPNLLPTYYGDAFQWDSATVINHNCVSDFTADINMIQLLGGTGTGTVSGFITEDQGFGSRPGHGHDQIFAPGGPLKGIDVKLGKNPGGGIQARTMSDSTGFYEFTNLPDDTFRIYVDIPGLPMDSFYIVVVTADSTVNQNYAVDSNSVFPFLNPIGMQEYASNVSSFVGLYPNPAHNNTSITFESHKENTASIRVLDITGKIQMKVHLKNLPKGNHEYQLNFADKLVAGIYFVEVMCDGKREIKKLVVE